jgi:predicted ABC-type transport system involved in lysophospholipase L1 biosynthesis ATPase subunit
MMPGLIGGIGFSEMRPRAVHLLQEVGLEVARALVLEPRLLLADEPTGNLDPKTGEQVLDLMLEMNRTRGTALVIATHSPDLATRLSRRVLISDGYLEECLP